MRKLFLSIAMAALSLLALANIASACNWWGYQPKAPSSLLKHE